MRLASLGKRGMLRLHCNATKDYGLALHLLEKKGTGTQGKANRVVNKAAASGSKGSIYDYA